LYGVSARERCSPESITTIASSSGKGTAWYSRVVQASSLACPPRPRAEDDWSITPTFTPVAFCSARWQASAASMPSISGRSPTAVATSSAADELIPALGGTSEETVTICGPAPSSSLNACTYARPPGTTLSTDQLVAGCPVAVVSLSTAA